ncbi:bifunctional riboflavin kinase/FAD synthetase [Roseiconus lacunae]|uniref:bifunctional riboflavin kinase/FAD synthetase n=1 Tax=Roseiconus lacunae TaxID=2605694 RepID=UPI001E3510AD|nr:bifunctional riboflavin kinase/FAD synthetase [Roseiconus lacunae]MCD0458525.1 bifunctional riboflavin kinase/FAD synthetase [Roseiconus lacunae]WRQ51986.1 bifunctional riboflavin kinase/FAD synthetase [Stieleria sp. HD01]
MTEIVSLADATAATIPAALHGCVASIGNFDGVHLGHAALLRQTRQLARRLDAPTVACVFDPHPIAILRPDAAPRRLSTISERARRMERLGIDYLVVIETTKDLLDLTAEAFFDALMINNLRAAGMVEGANFCFGKGRQGDVDLLTRLCQQHGIEFVAAELRSEGSEIISSTRIRQCLADGDVAAAHAMMDVPHRVIGEVIRGDGRGRTIGFPTANIKVSDVVMPAPGVYAGTAWIDDRAHPAAIHLGESPTFGSGVPEQVEVHVMDYKADLYGKSIAVDFVARVRGIERFESADALVAQLQRDIRSCRQCLQTASLAKESS